MWPFPGISGCLFFTWYTKTRWWENTHIQSNSQASSLMQSHVLIFTFKATGRWMHLNVTYAFSCFSFDRSFGKHFNIIHFTYISLLIYCTSPKKNLKIVLLEGHTGLKMKQSTLRSSEHKHTFFSHVSVHLHYNTVKQILLFLYFTVENLVSEIS